MDPIPLACPAADVHPAEISSVCLLGHSGTCRLAGWFQQLDMVVMCKN